MEDDSHQQDDLIEVNEARLETSSDRKTEEPTQPNDSNKKGSPILIIVIIIIVLVALGGGAYYLLKEPVIDEGAVSTVQNNSLTAPVVEVQATSTPEPSPEPIERDLITIRVENGTGIAKEASLLQDLLIDFGYSEIETGNANNQDNESTTVSFSVDLSQTAVDEITKILEDTYKSVRTKTVDLDDFDVQVVTGLRKGQILPTDAPAEDEPTPTEAEPTDTEATPTPTPA